MPSMPHPDESSQSHPRDEEIILGVDTHKDSHVAAIITVLGVLVATATFPTTNVWAVLEAAEGRCEHCGSLALEQRPSGHDGRPAPWASVGRRIGSLGHRLARFNGGSNNIANLCWSCLWCNTWPAERRPGATDHGGHQPPT